MVFRISGGGPAPEPYVFINKTTKEKFSLSAHQFLVAKDKKQKIIEAIANECGVRLEQVKLVDDFNNEKALCHKNNTYNFVVQTYKDIAFKQASNGLWTETILKICDHKTVKALLKANCFLEKQNWIN